MKTITASLNLSDLSKMIKTVEAYRNRFIKQCSLFCKRVVQEGSAEASRVYGSAVTVSTVEIENGYAIVANGKEVCFLEFGAGVETNSSHPMAGNFQGETGITVEKGSYSREHGHQLDYKDYWIYKGDVYDHVTPQPGLWRAEQKVIEVTEKIAEEVFK